MTKHLLIILCLAVLSSLSACKHPLDPAEQALADELVQRNQAYFRSLEKAGDVTPTRTPSSLESDENIRKYRQALEKIGGPQANANEKVDPGNDLLGTQNSQLIPLTLERAIALAIQNNPQAKVARLRPALSDTQILQAQAVFDATYFINASEQKIDTPLPPTLLNLNQFGRVQQDTFTLETGIRKPLTTGGQIQIATSWSRNQRVPSFFDVDTYYGADATISLQQPLLRNFGADINRSQIELSHSAKQQSLFDLKTTLQDVAALTEETYWNLYYTHEQLKIEQRLLKRAKKALDTIQARREFDAGSQQISTRQRFYAEQRRNVQLAQRTLRQTSDELKSLIFAKQLNLADEAILEPMDQMVDEPVQFNLREALHIAQRHRPDLQVALLAIKDASIRQRVADNQRLPLLNLSASARFQGISTDKKIDAYDNLADRDFIDYILGLQFEMPIGNRAAQALYKQRQIERQASVINYHSQVENALLEIKTALRIVDTTYQLINTNRDARVYSADIVRALQVQEETGGKLTPSFVDQKTRDERTLGDNEALEIRTLVEYQIAIKDYYRAIGTLLERDGLVLEMQGDAQ